MSKPDLDHRFGTELRLLAKTRAKAAAQDHDFHRLRSTLWRDRLACALAAYLVLRAARLACQRLMARY
jgi:hypothetical protein